MVNGLVMGVLFSIHFLLSSANNTFLSLLAMLITVAVVVVMYKMSINYRDKAEKGRFNYWTMVNLTILTFFFGGLIVAAFKLLYTSFIKPDFLTDFVNQASLAMDAMRGAMPEEFIDNYIELLEKYSTPLNFAHIAVWNEVLRGLFLGLILGIFVRKKTNIFEEENIKQ